MENHGCKKSRLFFENKFIIDGRLPSLNDYCKAERTGYHCANNMKRGCQNAIKADIRRSKIKPIKYPIRILYRFYEPNKRRDKDNIAGVAHKFIQDALVESGIIKDDGWDYVIGFSDEFYIDRKKPRIEVELWEVR